MNSFIVLRRGVPHDGCVYFAAFDGDHCATWAATEAGAFQGMTEEIANDVVARLVSHGVDAYALAATEVLQPVWEDE